MEAAVNDGRSDGIFSAAIDTNDGMVAAALTTAAQLTTTTTIAAVTIGWRCHHSGCHCALSLHPTSASVDNNRRHQRPPLLWPPSIATSVNYDCHCHHQQQSMTAGFWQLLSLTVWQQRWWLLPAAIAVIVDGGSGGIELAALMAVSSTVAVVDGGGNNGVFTNASHDDDRHPRPHRPSPCSPLDKDWTAGWRACRDASYLL